MIPCFRSTDNLTPRSGLTLVPMDPKEEKVLDTLRRRREAKNLYLKLLEHGDKQQGDKQQGDKP